MPSPPDPQPPHHPTLPQELSLEVCYSQGDKVRALHRLFFTSPAVLAWITARITAWSAVLACSSALDQLDRGATAGGPHEAAPPGGWMPLVWPRGLLHCLGLCSSGAGTDVESVAAAADEVLAHAQHVLASRQSRPQQHTSGLPPAPAQIVYYADPLYLSPVGDISDRFSSHQLYQRAWQDGIAGRMAQGPAFDCEADLADLREPSPALARWQRLMGRLLARCARAKLGSLLRWVQLQLMFSEECTSRLGWLSDKVGGHTRP